MDKEHRYHHHNNGNFSNGFLLGALVGGGLVFLLGTQKGKQVLKMLTENGIEGVSELRDLLNEDEDNEIVDEYIQDADMVDQELKAESRPQKTLKRFFKRKK